MSLSELFLCCRQRMVCLVAWAKNSHVTRHWMWQRAPRLLFSQPPHLPNPFLPLPLTHISLSPECFCPSFPPSHILPRSRKLPLMTLAHTVRLQDRQSVPDRYDLCLSLGLVWLTGQAGAGTMLGVPHLEAGLGIVPQPFFIFLGLDTFEEYRPMVL